MRPALVVTLLGAAAHFTTVIIQILIARVFGAGETVDAYFAAITLPQYVITVLTAVLPVVFIPVLASDAHSRGELLRATTSVLLTFTALMTAVALAGIAFASPLLHLATPGLSSNAHALAVTMSWILWPGIIGAAAVNVLTATSHSRHSFTPPAVALLVGGVLNVAIAVAMLRVWGIYGVAAGMTASFFVQVALLYRAVYRPREPRAEASASSGVVREVLVMFWPLALSTLLIKSTVVVERFLASEYPAGTISYVSYASRLTTLVAFILSIGVGTVIFPSIAAHVANARFSTLGAELSKSVRTMWLLVAPAVAIGFVLAQPAVAAILQRGKFTAEATTQVAALLQIYLLSLASTCLGMITGRVLYALKMANFMAVAGAIEAAAYVAYTALLVKTIGITGVAWGFVLYNTISITWHTAIIQRRVGWSEPAKTSGALLRTAIAAIAAGATAAVTMRLTHNAWLQLAMSGTAALIVYAIVLAVINPADFAALRRIVRAVEKEKGPRV
ncbi:MAG TPA: lipid II flippase MurJ [Thermoanaerobaculia bacterium]|nr:lipid II flippase MurJ [Thermoanaerobaculia bacterium]